LDLCAVILAGGQSRRMGFNKALLPIQGRPLIQFILERVRPLTDQVLVSANDPGPFEFLRLPVVADVFEGQGPLAGLHAAMLHSARLQFLLLACDLPNLHEAMLHRLAASVGDFDAVVPRTSDGAIHPLCAVYRRTCLPVIETNLRRGMNKVADVLLSPHLRVKRLGPEEGEFSDLDLTNLNTPSDLANAGKRHFPPR
jgi:molybdopterin-guanine dinucleotide biosynthesis protein A